MGSEGQGLAQGRGASRGGAGEGAAFPGSCSGSSGSSGLGRNATSSERPVPWSGRLNPLHGSFHHCGSLQAPPSGHHARVCVLPRSCPSPPAPHRAWTLSVVRGLPPSCPCGVASAWRTAEELSSDRASSRPHRLFFPYSPQFLAAGHMGVDQALATEMQVGVLCVALQGEGNLFLIPSSFLTPGMGA